MTMRAYRAIIHARTHRPLLGGRAYHTSSWFASFHDAVDWATEVFAANKAAGRRPMFASICVSVSVDPGDVIPASTPNRAADEELGTGATY